MCVRVCVCVCACVCVCVRGRGGMDGGASIRDYIFQNFDWVFICLLEASTAFSATLNCGLFCNI